MLLCAIKIVAIHQLPQLLQRILQCPLWQGGLQLRNKFFRLRVALFQELFEVMQQGFAVNGLQIA